MTEPQGRPIINGIELVCSRLGQYIDMFPTAAGGQNESIY